MNNLKYAKLSLLLCLVMVLADAFAQTDRDSSITNIIEKQGTTHLAESQDSIFFNYEKLDKYIQLAIENNPSGRISELKSLAALQDIKLAKYNWTNNLAGTLNLNENNAYSWGIGPPKTNLDGTPMTNSFFPRYLVSLKVPLGVFVLTPMEVKKATQLYKITLEEKENQHIALVNEVTKRYQKYIIGQKSLLIKLEAETKLQTLYGLISKNSNTKEIVAMEKEAQAFAAYSQSLELRNIAEAELRMAKFDLEQIIGTKIENVK